MLFAVGIGVTCGWKLQMLLKFMLYANLWLERNNRVLWNTGKSVVEVVDSIVWSGSEWVRNKKEF
jgi:hypothetical protein